MAKNSKSFDQRHANRLSPVTYGFKKVKELVITAGGLVGGWFAGAGLEKAMNKGEIKSIEVPFGGGTIKGTSIKLLGAVIGSFISGTIIAYEHWRKQESAKLAVGEINDDIANMKIRQRTDPELLKENDRLRAMLEEQTQRSDALASNHAARVGQPAASHVEKTAASAPAERSV